MYKVKLFYAKGFKVFVTLLMVLVMVIGSSMPVSAASKTTKKYKSLPINQSVLHNSYYQDNYHDYDYIVKIKVTKKNAQLTLKEYAGGKYVQKYRYDWETDSVVKTGKKKYKLFGWYSYSVNFFVIDGPTANIKVKSGLWHKKKVIFPKPGTYTVQLSFQTKSGDLFDSSETVHRYVDDKYPTWRFTYNNKRLRLYNIRLEEIQR